MFDFVNLSQIVLDMFLLFAVAIAVVRLMGSRTVGQLSPFDFLLLVGIGDIIVTAAMDPEQNLINGVAGLLVLLILQQILSYLSLKSKTLRKWFEGTPVTLIEDGRIIHENFVKTYFNFDDLRQELHRQGMDMTNLRDIKMARLESCGVFSVIKQPDKEPVTKSDLAELLKSLDDNPLSPLGTKKAQFDQLVSDLRQVIQYIENQQNDKVNELQTNAGQSVNNLH